MTDRRTFVGSIVGGFLASMMSRERPDTLLLVTDSLTNVDRKRVLDFRHGTCPPCTNMDPGQAWDEGRAMTLDDAVRAPEPGDATMQRYLVEGRPFGRVVLTI